MRVKKSDINVFSSRDKNEILSAINDIKPELLGKDEILAAIKGIKLESAEPVIVEQKIPDAILEQQRAMMEKISEVPVPVDFPSYHFEVNRSSDGFIKSVDATPKKTDSGDGRSVAKSWYKKVSGKNTASEVK